MKTQDRLTDLKTNQPQLQSFKSAFIVPIGFECIICKDNIVHVGDLYDLIDFLDNGEIYVRKVRFQNAYLRGYKLTVVVIDLKAGEMLKRSHRMNIETLLCDWVLTDTDFFNSNPEAP